MENRYEEEAGFGQNRDDLEQDDVEDEIVPDEIPEEDPDDEPENTDNPDDENPDNDGEERPETKKRDKAQVRINRLIKEKYKVASKAEKAMADADYWRQKYELSSQLNLRQSDLNAGARLEKARADQIAAIESGDAQAQADANIAIATATSDLQEISREKLRSEYDQRAKQFQEPYQPEPMDTEILNEWAQENNDWSNPESEKFNEPLVNYIREVDNWLGNQLRASGRTNLIGTTEYFDELDRHKEAFLKKSSQGTNTNQRRDLNMKKARGGASPVRGSSQTQYRNSSSYQLSPAEKAMVDSVSHAGVNEEIYKKAKLKYLKEQQLAERGAI